MEYHLEIKNLTHRFGGLQALTNVNINLKKGEIAGLIGPNGAGKTTVFNLVSGFYVPTEGDIVVGGVRINAKKPHEIASMKIGRTFQNIRLWSEMTVLDNIRIAQHYRLGYNAADALFSTRRYREREADIVERARELLEIFNLSDLAEEYPKNLPYGVQRRVEIARALSLQPDLLMLDEPAAGLSTADVASLIEYIRWIHEKFNLTIWMIEHQMEVIMTLCDQISVIDFGKEIAQGVPEEIQRNPEVIKAYLGDDAI
ncbi:high affinity branched-chain amino acid ABC transporter, ATP-binding protein [Treponema primitia ZAS-2]|uniref:High affinity branched-chain amino acid ABC transporter, ATP-binding protein n=1 Tax=Treponema primitia (strain ATCC BAA-887 / DSM 12427 / ZAS-2) TaxID=545694 RepID=F5YM70_TREPZ|nr:ABC transporter ATP-binding protein [Treponema primitia]AEF83591.1 high affinity branched-chain amino acid ABC transporter, ATP-binding protein [Treponema primitia ZAS-2]